jgi:diaminopimelate epimerase
VVGWYRPDVELSGPRVKQLCDRRFGVGADGVLLILPLTCQGAAATSINAIRMRVINADGSEAESCGNGLRCVAQCVARDPVYYLLPCGARKSCPRSVLGVYSECTQRRK